MLSLVRRFVDIRGGAELRAASATTAILFAMVAGHMMLETARDALFIGKLSAGRLPLVYAALAGLALVAIGLSNRIVERAGRRNALVATLVVAIYGTVIFYLLPRSGPVIFALYLWSGLIGTVVVIQFWIFVSQLFTVAQAKRLYGLLAAGGALGALVGASASALLLRLVPLDALLLSSAGMFMVSAFILTSLPSDDAAPGSSMREADGRESMTAVLRRYPYTLRLMAMVLIATVTVLTVDFMFKEAAERHVGAAELGGFFATAYAFFSAASLAVQLIGAGLLLRRLGVLTSLLIMPLLLAVGGAATIALGGALVIAVLTKGVDGSLRHSLQRVGTELLWMPLPAAVRARARGLLGGGLTRGAQALTAAALLGLGAVGLARPAVLGAIVAGLAVVWVGIAMSLRRPYLDLYRDSLARRPTETLADLDLNSLEILVEALSSADDNQVIAAMKLLAAKRRARLIPSLILYHGSADVLTEALRLVATADRDDWIPIAIKLLESDDEGVRAEALRALARRGKLPELADRIHDVSPRVRAQAVFWLTQDTDADELRSDPRVVELFALEDTARREALSELLRAIAGDGDGRWSEAVLELLDGDDFVVAELAVHATGVLRDPRFIPVLVDRLESRSGRAAVRLALIEIGAPALEALETAFELPETSVGVRLHLPRSIALFRSQSAAQFLLDRFASEPSGAVRYRILRVLARLVADEDLELPLPPIVAALEETLAEYYRLLALASPLTDTDSNADHEVCAEAQESSSLLQGLLADKLRQSLERTFLLLQIAHPAEDLGSVEAAVGSTDRRVRANALEFVDNLAIAYRRHEGGARVRELLRLALDDLPGADKVARAAVVTSPPRSKERAILALARDQDETTAAIAIYHAFVLGLDELRPEIAASLRDRPMVDSLGPELHQMLIEESGSA